MEEYEDEDTFDEGEPKTYTSKVEEFIARYDDGVDDEVTTIPHRTHEANRRGVGEFKSERAGTGHEANRRGEGELRLEHGDEGGHEANRRGEGEFKTERSEDTGWFANRRTRREFYRQ